jgi:hypothetical protein
MPDGNVFGNISVPIELACVSPGLKPSLIRDVTALLDGLAVVLSGEVCEPLAVVGGGIRGKSMSPTRTASHT